MYIVTFETWPNDLYRDQYLSHAQSMREEVEKIKGFVSVERFQSVFEKGKLLSMSVWENEEAIKEWKSQAEHKLAQEMGKNKYFYSYRIRVAKVEREYGNHS